MVFWISEDEAAPTMVMSAPVTRPPTISTHSTREIIMIQGLRRDFDLLRSGFIIYDTPILSGIVAQTLRNFRMDSRLPNTPTRKPTTA